MNKADSERIASLLENNGYKPSLNKKDANLIIINMCSVRQSAVDRVYGKIKDFNELKRKKKNLKTVLTGCILKEDKKKFVEKFDLVLSIKDLPKWPKTFSRFFQGREKVDMKKKNYLDIRPKYGNKFSAFVPISSGCNNACTYCAVPFTRGHLICRDYKKILKEVKVAIQKGFKEIWLLGQNVNDYKSNIKSENQSPKEINFAKLLKIINDIKGNFWIRFTSPNPADFSNELIKTMKKCKKITPYLNLPLQSGDDKILKKMNRRYTVEKYKNLVKNIRKEIPNISLSTDIIVGFPGETKKQFENTVKLMKKIKFDMAYIAKYSPRPGTIAARLKDNVSQKEKNRREKIINTLLEKTALENNEKYIGRRINVLPNKYKNGFLTGKSLHYKTVKFKGKKNLIGKLVKVKIVNALPWGLKGKLE